MVHVEINRGPARAATIAFIGLILGGTLLDLVNPMAAPRVVGRDVEIQEARRRTARWSDGSRGRLIESEIADRSAVRAYLLPLWALTIYEVFTETHRDVLPGRDGWFFHTSRALVPDAPAKTTLAHATALVAAVNRLAAAHGYRLVFAPVPRKEAACAQRLAPGLDPHPELDRDLAAACQAHGIATVDLWPLLAGPAAEPLWHRTDAHWDFDGALVAARAIAMATGLLAPEGKESGRLVRTPRVFTGDLLRTAALIWPPETTLSPFAETGVFWVRLEGAPDPERNPPALVLAGTSFSQLAGLDDLLRHVTGRPVASVAATNITPAMTLARALARRGDPPGTPLVWEVPDYAVFDRAGMLYGLEETLIAHPAACGPSVFPLTGPAALAAPSFPVGRIDVAEASVSAQLPSGVVWHPGDGTLAIRIRGHVVQGRPYVLVAVPGNPLFLRVLWPPELTEIIVPVIASEAADGAAVALGTDTPGTVVTIDEVAVVPTFDFQNPISGTRGRRVPGGGGAVRDTMTFEITAAQIAACPTIALELDTPGGSAVVTVQGPDRYTQTVAVTGRHPSVLLAMSSEARPGHYEVGVEFAREDASTVRCGLVSVLRHPR